MNPLLQALPLDLTATNPDNRVLGEYHDLSALADKPMRAFGLEHGCFYTDDVQLRDNTGYRLKAGDYQFTGLNAKASGLSGREVCSVIVILNPRVTSHLYIDAQMVGGEFTSVAPAIIELARGLLSDTRAVKWANLKDRPGEFTPGGHTHALWELYGFEPYRFQVERMVEAILDASQREMEALFLDLTRRFDELRARRNAQWERLADHMRDQQNPHRVNVVQIQLERLSNIPPATEAEARVLGIGQHDRMMTPLRTAQYVETNFGDDLTRHTTNRQNPHRLTPQQVDSYPARDVTLMLSQRLNRTGTAVNSLRLGGYTYAQLYANARKDLHAPNVTSERFAQARLGAGSFDHRYILTGDQRWTYIPTLFNQYSSRPPRVFTVGYRGSKANCNSYIAQTFADINTYPVGTIVLVRFLHQQGHYNGNGTTTTTLQITGAVVRTASGWVGPN